MHDCTNLNLSKSLIKTHLFRTVFNLYLLSLFSYLYLIFDYGFVLKYNYVKCLSVSQKVLYNKVYYSSYH